MSVARQLLYNSIASAHSVTLTKLDLGTPFTHRLHSILRIGVTDSMGGWSVGPCLPVIEYTNVDTFSDHVVRAGRFRFGGIHGGTCIGSWDSYRNKLLTSR